MWGLSIIFSSSPFFLLPAHITCLLQTKSCGSASPQQLALCLIWWILVSEIWQWLKYKKGGWARVSGFGKYFAFCCAQWISSTHVPTIALLSFWHTACRYFSLCTWLILLNFIHNRTKKELRTWRAGIMYFFHAVLPQSFLSGPKSALSYLL